MLNDLLVKSQNFVCIALEDFLLLQFAENSLKIQIEANDEDTCHKFSRSLNDIAWYQEYANAKLRPSIS